jgi:anti-sigma-K factor RskA
VDVSSHRDQDIDLCAGYALGCLDAADRNRAEEHLASGCPLCQAALAEFSDASVLLAASAPPALPGPTLRQRVLAAVATPVIAEPEPPVEPFREPIDTRGRVIELRPRRAPFLTAGWGWAAAAALLALVTTLQWTQAVRLRGELDRNRLRLADLERRLAEESRWSEVLNSPAAKVVVLTPTERGSAELKARVTYDPVSRRAVVVFENVRAPRGSDYQLWAILGGVPASLGLVKADAAGRAMMRLENVGGPALLAAFAVSLEPAGGSPNPNAPSGPVVRSGKLEG